MQIKNVDSTLLSVFPVIIITMKRKPNVIFMKTT